MKDDSFYALRALSLGLCLRRISILLLLSQQDMGIMSLSRATGNYRQLITNDLRSLLKKNLVEQSGGSGRVKIYKTSQLGIRVLGALKEPLELKPKEDS